MHANKSRPLVSIIGAANLDLELRLLSGWQDGVSNAVSRIERTGGVAANVAIQLAEDCETHLFTAIGNDAAGDKIVKELADRHIAVKNLANESASGLYVAVLEQNGELKAGLADTAGIESIDFPQWQQVNDQLKNLQAVCFDCNCNSSLISGIANYFTNSYAHNDAKYPSADKPLLVAIGVSPSKIRKLRDHTKQIDLLFANRSELQELSGLKSCDTLDRMALSVYESGIKQVVATDGPRDIVVIDHGCLERLPVPSLAQRSSHPGGSEGSSKVKGSANGAGDALAGATIAALLRQVPLNTSVREFGRIAAMKILTASTVTGYGKDY